LTWPVDWQTNALFFLRWVHLLSATAWLGTLAAFFLIGRDGLLAADSRVSLLRWMRGSALAAVMAGLADYVLILAAERIWPRVFVFLAAWTLTWLGAMGLLRLSLSGRLLASGASLAAALVLFLALVGCSGDLYMRRGGSPKAIALSLGGGLALVMFANTWVFLTPKTAETPLGLLAARVNAWLAPVVLFLMGAASHFPIFRARS